jgi:hypothetical protein
MTTGEEREREGEESEGWHNILELEMVKVV